METHPGTLYVVAVPIGNLGDFTPRALEVLAQMDYLACEEVQATRRLLAAYSLSAQYLSYRESGREKAGEAVVELLQQGAKVALVAGAGTPAISDPGRDLVAKCREEGLPVVPIPGVSALTAALSVCGLPGRRLAFEGFLPRAEGERRQFLASLRSEERTCVFFEAPHRLLATLELLVEDEWLNPAPQQPVVVRNLQGEILASGQTDNEGQASWSLRLPASQSELLLESGTLPPLRLELAPHPRFK